MPTPRALEHFQMAPLSNHTQKFLITILYINMMSPTNLLLLIL